MKTEEPIWSLLSLAVWGWNSCQDPATGLTEQATSLSCDQPRRTDRVNDDPRQSLRLSFPCQREVKIEMGVGGGSRNQHKWIWNCKFRTTATGGAIHSGVIVSLWKQQGAFHTLVRVMKGERTQREEGRRGFHSVSVILIWHSAWCSGAAATFLSAWTQTAAGVVCPSQL